MSEIIPSQRQLFDIPRDVAYLNCAYMSPLMRHVLEAGETALRWKSQPWNLEVSHFYENVRLLRQRVARLMGCDALDVAFVPSVSYGIGVAVANLKIPEGSEIVVLAEQFPSNVYPWREAAESAGARVRTIARPEDGDWTPAVLQNLDSGVSVAALPHCHWADGALLDLERIGMHCREKGIALVLDTTQSLGAMTLDLKKVRPAFMVAASYKWLMGPYSFGYLYVDPAFHSGKPLEFNWMPRKNSFQFDRLVHYTDELEPGAERFDVGERSNFVAVAMANLAIEQILEWQVERIEKTLGVLTQEIKEAVAPMGFTAAGVHAPHLLGLRAPKGLRPDDIGKLKEANVFASVRGDAIRVAPHLYNDGEDVDRLVKALSQLV
jgi:selenocysteine lyase/cysteine desulfurase